MDEQDAITFSSKTENTVLQWVC